jgi:hypothetical protein
VQARPFRPLVHCRSTSLLFKNSVQLPHPKQRARLAPPLAAVPFPGRLLPVADGELRSRAGLFDSTTARTSISHVRTLDNQLNSICLGNKGFLLESRHSEAIFKCQGPASAQDGLCDAQL